MTPSVNCAEYLSRTCRESTLSREEAMRMARDLGWAAIWEETFRDLRYGARSLARNRRFALASIVTLGLGIGVSTAVFSIVNIVLLAPLPYRDSDRLVRIVERAAPRTAGGPLLRRTSMTWLEMSEWRTRSRTLAELAYTA